MNSPGLAASRREKEDRLVRELDDPIDREEPGRDADISIDFGLPLGGVSSDLDFLVGLIPFLVSVNARLRGRDLERFDSFASLSPSRVGGRLTSFLVGLRALERT